MAPVPARRDLPVYLRAQHRALNKLIPDLNSSLIPPVEEGVRGHRYRAPDQHALLVRLGSTSQDTPNDPLAHGVGVHKLWVMSRRVGSMKKLGEVQVVFSRRRGDGKAIALVTNDLARPARKVVADYLRRWAIELLIKDEKQHLGLGAYRVLRYRAVVRHLHLVDCAYACLTHLGMDAQRAQGRKKNKTVLRLPPIRQLKGKLRQAVWNEAVKDVVKVSHERPVIRRLEKLLAA